jgi:triacylglycerol lipase
MAAKFEISKDHAGKFWFHGRLTIALILSAAVICGCPSASATSEPLSAEPWALLNYSPGEFDQLLGDATAIANGSAGAVDGAATNPIVSDFDSLLAAFSALINGVSPPPSIPGELVTFSGSPSLLAGLGLLVFEGAKPIENLLGIDFIAALTPLIDSATPPSGLESMYGLTVTETDYDGMPVYELTPPNPSGEYVVAIHGGAWVYQATIEHWWAYSQMAQQTDATIVVPIYPLAPEGTAGTVEPEIAGLISSEIAAHGANDVHVYGDSAGGGMALAIAELLAREGMPEPGSMVLDSPALDLAFNNPNIAFITDPILNVADGQKDALLWAGDLPLTNPLVSPLYGSLEGLPPTYVYSGSNEFLAPDVLNLEQDAITQDAPISFILRNGEVHDWALVPTLDGAQVQEQIYQELGLTGASTSAATANPGIVDALPDGLQNLATDLSSNPLSSFDPSDLSTDLTNALSAVSTDVTNVLSALSTEGTALWSDLSAVVGSALTLF